MNVCPSENGYCSTNFDVQMAAAGGGGGVWGHVIHSYSTRVYFDNFSSQLLLRIGHTPSDDS